MKIYCPLEWTFMAYIPIKLDENENDTKKLMKISMHMEN